MAAQIIIITPLWVWVLLAFLLYLGIRALRPGTAPLWRIAILPALFAELRYWLTEMVLSGTLTGMFVGRFVGLWQQYRAAPHEDLSATA
jgi:fucose permease